MCRGWMTARSQNTRLSPNAPSASRIADSTPSRSCSAVATSRIPRPPPPATALTKTGNPMAWVASTMVSRSSLGSVEARTGSPASCAAPTARTLLPASSSTSAPGPMKAIPAASQARARSGFSDRKP